MSVGIEGNKFCTNLLPPFPCRQYMWVTSPLEHPLRNSKLSLTQAHLTCGYPPSFAPAQPVVTTDTPYTDHPLISLPACFAPLALMTHMSHVCSYTSQVQTLQVFHLRAYPRDLQHHIWIWEHEGIFAYDTIRVMRKQKLSQDWLWSDHCLQNRCRTIWQDTSQPNSCRYWPSYPQDPVPGEAVPVVTHK